MELIEKYLRYLRFEKNYSSNTEISYSIDLNQFVDFLELNYPELDLLHIEGDVVRRWIVMLMEEGVSPRTVNRKLSSLKSFYRYLLKIGDVLHDPMRKVMGPKVRKPIPSFVNDIDMAEVLDENHFDDTFESVRNRVILELFYVTGVRRAELIALKDVDVDLVEMTIKVTGKRNKQRIVPINERMRKLLSDYLEIRNTNIKYLSGFLFVRNNGEPLYPMLVYRIVTSSLKWISTLSKASPHVLRHSFATGMLNNGADINAVKDLLGHSSLASTEVYTHTSFEELKKVYNKAHPRA